MNRPEAVVKSHLDLKRSQWFSTDMMRAGKEHLRAHASVPSVVVPELVMAYCFVSATRLQ